ncbi:MAG TPA: hydantoinase/oxoprolinase family protein, partial [Solirubrobacteraceae bacterium]|nr:hydantoinase/oxoprolinase family protein [Solirubrobacteraceae bacterium]
GFALMPFGGAGPLHAVALAAALGIGHVLCPRACGVLCALGLAAAAPRHDVSRTVMLRGAELTAARLAQLRDSLLSEADAALAGERSRARLSFELRYRGQAFELAVEPGDPDDCRDPHALREAFAVAHEQRYGYREDPASVELVNVRASVWGPAPQLAPTARDDSNGALAAGTTSAGGPAAGEPAAGGPAADALAPGARLTGPSVHALGDSTLYVAPGWSGAVDQHGTIVLEDSA